MMIRILEGENPSRKRNLNSIVGKRLNTKDLRNHILKCGYFIC